MTVLDPYVLARDEMGHIVLKVLGMVAQMERRFTRECAAVAPNGNGGNGRPTPTPVYIQPDVAFPHWHAVLALIAPIQSGVVHR
ncbi:hypothetical protein ABIB57_005212 [Devosia sp. UYZn731]|uniref:hypothetical protein n=1 Tax=Devosia sp. UYZn731 TaxID=3156345 RepID=UPI00339AEFBB